MKPEQLDNTEVAEKTERTPIYSSVGSLGIHILVVIVFILLSRYSQSFTAPGGYYVDVMALKGSSSGEKEQSARPPAPKTVNKPAEKEREIYKADRTERVSALNKKETALNNSGLNKPDGLKDSGTEKKGSLSGYQNIETAGFDTTTLAQVYREPTLNVQMKYPSGWVYIDQQRKKKLDGITFWAEASGFNPPPYIHVEVVEKYIFNPGLFSHKYDFGSFTGYYNDPVELENQVSQIIFIRTEDEEDYSIKLIMNNREAFRQFQPVFFAIIKSFRFGSSFLF